MHYAERIKKIISVPPRSATEEEKAEIFEVWSYLREGKIRSAEQTGGIWKANPLVKEAIIWGFRAGVLRDIGSEGEAGIFGFTEKDTLPLRRFTTAEQVRIVPGGSSIRDGSYVAAGVIMMPPSYINIGAYVDEGTLIDSHVLVGSCAQIGKRVHLSAGVQIGGVLEPVGALPVIIEDDVMVGGNCGIYEGTIIRSGSVIGTGVILNGSTPVYDLVREVVLRRTAEHPLEIPAGAVVVQGSRPLKGDFAMRSGLHIYTPIIVKYRDEKTDAGTALEESLRL